jgi:hypothetical protein
VLDSPIITSDINDNSGFIYFAHKTLCRTISDSHHTDLMDYGKSVVIEENPISPCTQCYLFLVTLFSHQLFLLICDFPVTKLEEAFCLR